MRRHRPWRGRVPSCRLDHAAVLDGRTLTGQMTVAGVPRSVRGLAVVFTKTGGTVRRYELPAAGRWGSAAFRIAIPLEGAGSADLRTGRWRVGLEVSAGAGTRVIPVSATWQDDGRGPTLWNPRSPVTGRRYRPAADAGGNFALVVKAYAAHAEVDRVSVDTVSVDVTGRLIGKGLGSPADGSGAVVLHEATTGHRRTVPATITRLGFAFAVPLASWPVASDHSTWSVTLEVVDGPSLAVKKRLSDLRNPSSMIRYPAADLPDGAQLEPGYAADGRLILTVTPVQRPADAAPTEPPA